MLSFKHFVEKYGQKDEELVVSLGYNGESDSGFSEFAINMGYRWCFSHSVWLNRDGDYTDDEQRIFDTLTTQSMEVYSIGTELRYCGENTSQHKSYAKYEIVDYYDVADEQPYAVSTENKGLPDEQILVMFSQEDLGILFEVPNPKKEIRENDDFILIAGFRQLDGFACMVRKGTQLFSHWFDEATKRELLAATEEAFNEYGNNLIQAPKDGETEDNTPRTEA